MFLQLNTREGFIHKTLGVEYFHSFLCFYAALYLPSSSPARELSRIFLFLGSTEPGPGQIQKLCPKCISVPYTAPYIVSNQQRRPQL